MHAMSNVLELPPRESDSNRVNLELLQLQGFNGNTD